MHEGLELLRLFGDTKQMGVTLALIARCQGSSVSAVLANLKLSAEAGGSQATSVLLAFEQADAALKQMSKH